MAQTLALKLEEFKKALDTLREALALPYDTVVRDSVIKRFEYTFELAWKTAKTFLDERMGAVAASPKECFRELRRNQFISDEETEALLEMTDRRNEIIHTYHEVLANELFGVIQKQYAALLLRVYQAFIEHE